MKFDNIEEMKEKEIGEFFKDQFEHYDPTPPEGTWENIAQNNDLKQYNKKQSLKRRGNITIVSSVVIAVALVAAYFIFSSPEETYHEENIVEIQVPETPQKEEMTASVEKEEAEEIRIPENNVPRKERSSLAAVPSKEAETVSTKQNSEEMKAADPVAQKSEPTESAVPLLSQTPLTPQKEVVRPEIPQHPIPEHKAVTESEIPGETFPIEPTYEEIESDKFYLPNAFTPNGDGLNDHFTLFPPAEMYAFEISIFNRSGHLVYRSKNPEPGWDGNFNGQPAPEGAYIYFVTYKDKQGKLQQLKGSLVLIR